MSINSEALKNIRIADFSWVWAGPYGTLLLSFLGAEIIKIESHARIDQTRQGSITTGDDFEDFNASPTFNNANLNKKSISLDLKSQYGIELAKKIVGTSDVVVENMRPGVMNKLGLGYNDLAKVKQDVIMISASGFGSSGPYREYAGYAPMFAAFGGLAHLTGYEDSEPNTMSGVMDLRVGTVLAFAILAALIHRQKTGEGQFIDLSSSECVSSLIGAELMDYTMNKRSPSRSGNRDTVMAPHNCYRCKGDDKWISIAVANDEEWVAFRGAMGNPEWAINEAYSDAYRRHNNQKELDKRIGDWTINFTSHELMALLQNAGVAAMPSLCAEEILADQHVKERGLLTQIEHPVMGKKVVLSPPWKLSETPARIHSASPLLGEHNNEVFGGLLGMSGEEIKKLTDEKIIY